MQKDDHVVLVNEHDEVIGIEEKLKAHQLALLHRAFSVFIYRKINDELEFLLQQRHQNKYHCGGLWTNTCCSHPRLSETIIVAAQKRLKEEMSIELPLKALGTFQYKVKFENGLSEHELDHVLVGECDSPSLSIVMHPNEVQDFRWISITQLKEELNAKPETYTPWFKSALSLVLVHLQITF